MTLKVQIRRNGQIISADFTGYYQYPLNGTYYPSFVFKLNNKIIKGTLREGDELLSSIPSYNQWKLIKDIQNRERKTLFSFDFKDLIKLTPKFFLKKMLTELKEMVN